MIKIAWNKYFTTNRVQCQGHWYGAKVKGQGTRCVCQCLTLKINNSYTYFCLCEEEWYRMSKTLNLYGSWPRNWPLTLKLDWYALHGYIRSNGGGQKPPFDPFKIHQMVIIFRLGMQGHQTHTKKQLTPKPPFFMISLAQMPLNQGFPTFFNSCTPKKIWCHLAPPHRGIISHIP